MIHPVEADMPEYKKRVKQMKGAAKDALDIARAGAGYPEAEKELDEILVKAKFVKISGENLEYITTLEEDKTALLAWRDKDQQALYQRLAAEAVMLYKHEAGTFYKTATGMSNEHARPVEAIPLSKLKAIMEIKEL